MCLNLLYYFLPNDWSYIFYFLFYHLIAKIYTSPLTKAHGIILWIMIYAHSTIFLLLALMESIIIWVVYLQTSGVAHCRGGFLDNWVSNSQNLVHYVAFSCSFQIFIQTESFHAYLWVLQGLWYHMTYGRHASYALAINHNNYLVDPESNFILRILQWLFSWSDDQGS